MSPRRSPSRPCRPWITSQSPIRWPDHSRSRRSARRANWSPSGGRPRSPRPIDARAGAAGGADADRLARGPCVAASGRRVPCVPWGAPGWPCRATASEGDEKVEVAREDAQPMVGRGRRALALRRPAERLDIGLDRRRRHVRQANRLSGAPFVEVSKTAGVAQNRIGRAVTQDQLLQKASASGTTWFSSSTTTKGAIPAFRATENCGIGVTFRFRTAPISAVQPRMPENTR